MKQSITKHIIALHQQGYVYDFQQLKTDQLICIQTAHIYPIPDLLIELIVKNYDQLSGSSQYIYSVDTFTDAKGLLIGGEKFS